jgi:hypothetical protein
MARVSLARQQLSDVGVSPVYFSAASEGHYVENDGKVILHVRNASAEGVAVSVLSGFEKNGLKLADRVVFVPADSSVFIGPLDPIIYNQSSGHAHIDYSAVEGVTVAALKTA